MSDRKEDTKRRQSRRQYLESLSIPKEIKTGRQSSAGSHITVAASMNTIDDDRLHWASSQHQKVHVLAEKEIQVTKGDVCVKSPPEPTECPPVPKQMLKFLVLGEKEAGKTSLVQRFLHREYASQTRDGYDQTQRNSPPWSVEYGKKDIAFWQEGNTVACVRVQIWDMTAGGRLEQRDEWEPLMNKDWDGLILVASIAEGYAALAENIIFWSGWLQRTRCVLTTPVTLFINKQDMLPPNRISPSMWISVGSNVFSLCQKLGIQNWHLTSCCKQDSGGDSSVEDAFIQLIRDTIKEQKRPVSANVEVGRLSSSRRVVEAQAVPIYSPTRFVSR